MMKYRDFMTLTDDEIKFIMCEIFHDMKIKNIKRFNNTKHYEVTLISTWYDGEEEIEIEDSISLFQGNIHAPFSLNTNEIVLYNKFLLAKGMHEYLKDNPYLTMIENVNGVLVRKEA